MSSIFQAIIDFSKLDYSIVAVFVSVLAFYIPTMKNRREKAYYDFSMLNHLEDSKAIITYNRVILVRVL